MPNHNLFTSRKITAGVFLLLLASAGTLSFAYMRQRPSEEPTTPPPGNWSLSSGLYTSGEPENMPVVVMSVTTDSTKGLVTNKAQLQNVGDKPATAVKFRWKLYRTDEPDNNLLTGETPLIDVVLPPGEKRTVQYPIVSFAKIHKPLLRYGALSGEYRLEITLGEVRFEDGSAWLFDDAKTASGSPPFKILNASLQGNECCPQQRCFWQGGRIPPRYDCVRTAAFVYCSPAFSECTEGRCPSTWRFCSPLEP